MLIRSFIQSTGEVTERTSVSTSHAYDELVLIECEACNGECETPEDDVAE